jgi:hypothetical protein
MATINNSTKGLDNSLYYDERFRRVLDDHLPIFRQEKFHTKVLPEPAAANRNKNTFYDLLAESGVQYHLHWFVMRLNGLGHPSEYDGEPFVLLLPNEEELNKIVAFYQSSI